MFLFKTSILFFWSCSPAVPNAFETGFSSATQESLGGWLLLAIFLSQPCPEVTTCSGVYSVPSSTKSVTREDLPPPRWLDEVVGFCQWSKILTISCTDFIASKIPFTWSLHTPWSVLSLLSQTPPPDTPPGSPPRNAGGPGMCLKFPEITSRILHRCSQISWQADLWQTAAPPRLVGLTVLPLTARVRWAPIATQNLQGVLSPR